MKKIVVILLLLSVSTSLLGQQPKLYLKAYAGIHGQKYIYKSADSQTEYYPGWQAGFGFRVSYRKVFGELGFDFIRSKITGDLGDTLSNDLRFFDVKLNSLNIPIKVGFIPYKSPFFKWYVYTGFGNRLNTQAIISFRGETLKFKPSELHLRVYNLDFLLGTQADLGWLNIDIYYSTGITNSYVSEIRTNYHQFVLNFGFLF